MRKTYLTGGLALTLSLAAASAVVAQGPLSVESSSVAQLMADAKAKAVLEKHLPGISEHPSYNMFKGMTLVQLKPMSGGQITDATLKAIKADLSAL